ncbi:hypothetical protein vB_PsyM_KIL3b_0058 [Pseudomonas phage vB_PsyM_KIL3b]|uniref:Head-tail adaptor n=4 Tax=Pseudomonas phage vB_PsyM_KIL1 TaxID=1777065 RepID=A0A142IE10_9CAUD|nr:head protein [Pseudomonas phage vB_PsyM_KIL1]AMR57305.1 hypothetical protein vB_PsyM_KIL1_0058 [Pseudomonas phage vB_PsyM_KIL1]AMR57465.1 hypothetical protein vB_PsyM_KIL2_0063 [Pseudomonas phage vB_PsyM_KIL2]AMR57625.1 hypothetical protein vB_PsyM_KIL3_0058 [Pseudomonas phage vB_PsyM_KIL3]AMR58123.1 hypothetical protein vB_PsyM_KIL3b_0058 [Pseudomonas phage vB_PsyM_KIL3b]
MLNPPLLLTGRVKLQVIRRESETIVRGRPVDGLESVVEVVCNVQPILKSTDTSMLPEADRSKAAIKVYTNGAALRQRKEGVGGWAADRFYWQQELYEVLKVINYDIGILSHYKAICFRVELT